MPELMEFAYSEMEWRHPEVIKTIQKPPYNVQVYTLPKNEMRKMRDASQGACIKAFQKAIGKDLADSMIKAARELTPPELALD